MPPPRKKPATPVRGALAHRRRSTRSQTRSPSPTPVERIAEPAALDTLAEVEEAAADDTADVAVPDVAAITAADVDDIDDELDGLDEPGSSQIEDADLEENLDDDDDVIAGGPSADQDVEMTDKDADESPEAATADAAAEGVDESATAEQQTAVAESGADVESDNAAAEQQDAAADAAAEQQDAAAPAEQPDAEAPAEQPAAATERPARRALSPVNADTFFTAAEDEPELRTDGVRLSWIDSDIYLKLDAPDCLSVTPLNHTHLSLAYGGVRGTHGVRSGRVCYEVHNSGVQKPNGGGGSVGNDEQYPLDLRVGWSVGDSGLQLGESPLSFAYSSAGKKATNNVFEKYGVHLLRNDVIGVYLDLESEPCRIEYTVNGLSKGVAFEFQLADLGGRALFPHVSSKSVTFQCNFGALEGEQMLVNTVLPEFDQPDNRSYRHRTRRTRKCWRNGKGTTATTTTTESESESTAVSCDAAKDVIEAKLADTDVVNSEAEVAGAVEDGVEQATDGVEKAPEVEADAQSATETPNAEVLESEGGDAADLKTELEIDAEPSANSAVENDQMETTEHSESADNKPADDEAKSTETADAVESNDNAIAEQAPAAVSEETEDNETAAQAAVAVEADAPVLVVHALLDGYVFIGLVSAEELVAGPQRVESRHECEVIVLVGLPGAGKSYWVNEHLGLKQPTLQVAKPSAESRAEETTAEKDAEKDAENPPSDQAVSADDTNAVEDAAAEPAAVESIADAQEAEQPSADDSIADAEIAEQQTADESIANDDGDDAAAIQPPSPASSKSYYVIGAAMLLERMRIFGEPRQHHMYSRRYLSILRNLSDTCNQLVAIASKRRRNYIIDQPHVTQHAQRTAIRHFGEFRRIAVVLVPAESDYRDRRQQQQEQHQMAGSMHLYTQNQENTMKGE